MEAPGSWDTLHTHSRSDPGVPLSSLPSGWPLLSPLPRLSALGRSLCLQLAGCSAEPKPAAWRPWDPHVPHDWLSPHPAVSSIK